MRSDTQIFVAGGTCVIDDVDVFVNRVRQFANANKIVIQLFDANKLYGDTHLLSTAYHALRSEREDRMTTNSIEMELLLYAAGERQLKVAIPKIGIKQGHNNVGIVFINRSKGTLDENRLINTFFSLLTITRDDHVLTGTEETLRLFGITDQEILTVSKENYGSLILEKIALVDIIK
jgi:KEOPS complex subunit Cgi121